MLGSFAPRDDQIKQEPAMSCQGFFNQAFNRYRRKRRRKRTPRKNTEENSVSTFGRFRLCTGFESSPVSVNPAFTRILTLIKKPNPKTKPYPKLNFNPNFELFK